MIQKRPTPSALRIVLAGALVGLVLPTLGACGSKQSEAPPPDTAQNPKHDQTSGDRIKRAEQFIQAKAFDAARNELNQAVAEDPHNAKALFYLGVASEALGDAEGAKSNYRKALGENPKLVDAAQNLSALLLDGGDPKSALTVAEAGLAAEPNDPVLLQTRALALEGAGKREEARKAYQAALQASPKDSNLRFNYAHLLVDLSQRAQGDQAQKNKQDAIKQLEELLNLEKADVLTAVSTEFAKLSHFDGCVKALDRAIKLKPDAESFTKRGLCKHQVKGDTGEAQDYEQALKSDANYTPAHYYLGRFLVDAGKKTEARDHLKKAAELGGDTSIGKKAKEELARLDAAPAPKKK